MKKEPPGASQGKSVINSYYTECVERIMCFFLPILNNVVSYEKFDNFTNFRLVDETHFSIELPMK